MNIDALNAEIWRWIGTPYVAAASLCGQGCDCAGLILGVAAQFALQMPTRTASLMQALTAPMFTTVDDLALGDILVFAPVPGGVAQHLAWVAQSRAGLVLVHAHWQKGVVANRYGSFFQQRQIAILRHQEIQQWPL